MYLLVFSAKRAVFLTALQLNNVILFVSCISVNVMGGANKLAVQFLRRPYVANVAVLLLCF